MSSTGDLVLALEACLNEMRAGGVDADTAASRYPEVADELREQLFLAEGLAQLGPLSAPTADFSRRLALDLAAAPPPRAIREAREAARGPSLLRRLWRSTAVTAATAAAAIVFLCGGAIYASADALPGQALYAVKRGVESARLVLSAGEDLQLHLDFASRRLAEALLAPDRAGELLADFSREVTAALAEADRALAAGAPREQVAGPLLEWLLDTRGQLVAVRPRLPSMAWRGALALVDEAIAMLRTEQAFSASAVPRLADASVVLRRRTDATLPWLRSDVDPWPYSDLIPLPSAADRSGQTRGGDTVGNPPADAPVVDPAAGALVVGPSAGALLADPSPAPVVGEAPAPLPSPTAPPNAPPPGGSGEQPRPTPKPPATPTAMTLPSATSTAEPQPTAEPATPTSTDVPPPMDTPTPTATAVPVNLPPVIERVTCQPETVMVYDTSDCRVVARDPEDDALSYEWSVDWGEMKNADQPNATYLAIISIGGIAKVDVPIHIVVRDSYGNQTAWDIRVFVVPRVK